MPDASRLISLSKAARMAEVSDSTINGWRVEGIVTVYDFADHPSIDQDELQQIIELRKKTDAKNWKRVWLEQKAAQHHE